MKKVEILNFAAPDEYQLRKMMLRTVMAWANNLPVDEVAAICFEAVYRITEAAYGRGDQATEHRLKALYEAESRMGDGPRGRTPIKVAA